MHDAARIEDLEEALRKVVIVLDPVHNYQGIDKTHAAICIALAVLDLDEPPPVPR